MDRYKHFRLWSIEHTVDPYVKVIALIMSWCLIQCFNIIELYPSHWFTKQVFVWDYSQTRKSVKTLNRATIFNVLTFWNLSIYNELEFWTFNLKFHNFTFPFNFFHCCRISHPSTLEPWTFKLIGTRGTWYNFGIYLEQC